MGSNTMEEKTTEMEISIDVGQEKENMMTEKKDSGKELNIGKEQEEGKKTADNNKAKIIKTKNTKANIGISEEPKEITKKENTLLDEQIEEEENDESMELLNENNNEEKEEADILNDDLDSDASEKLWMTQNQGIENEENNEMEKKPAYIVYKKKNNMSEKNTVEEDQTETTTTTNETAKKTEKEKKVTINNPPMKNPIYNKKNSRQNNNIVTEDIVTEGKIINHGNETKLSFKDAKENTNGTKWNIVVTPTSQNTVFQIREILKDVSGILQSVDEELILVTHKSDEDTKQESIKKDKDIPTTGTEIEKFVDNPRTNKNGKLIFRIHIISKMNMDIIMSEQTIRQWMIRNKIKMFESKLTTDKPIFAGFYEEPNPNKKGGVFLEKKIKHHIGEIKIEFQVEIRPLYVEGKGNSCLIYMIMTSIEYVNTLRDKLKEDSEHLHKFYSWPEYQDLSKLQKVHLICEQKNHNQQFKSIIIDGFKNTRIYEKENTTEINNKMTEGVWEESSIMELSQIKNTEDQSWEEQLEFEEDESVIYHPSKIDMYIKNEFVLQNGEQMIKGVTGPVGGEIQVWYGKEAINQTITLISVLKTELARHMTAKCINMTFENPEEICREVNNSKQWTPNELLSSVPVASYAYATKTYDSRDKNNKKKKTYFNLTESSNQEKTNITEDNKEGNAKVTFANNTNDKSTTMYRDTTNNQATANNMRSNLNSKKHENNGQTPGTENNMKNYCLELINKSKNELIIDIKKNSERIEQINKEAKEEMKKIEEGMISLKENTTTAIQNLQMENIASTNTVIKNQESMMEILKGMRNASQDNENDTHKNNNTKKREINNETREGIEKENNNTNQHTIPNRTATPFGFIRGRCIQHEQEAGQQ
jgi:uncharacterized protein (DUF2384 family)